MQFFTTIVLSLAAFAAAMPASDADQAPTCGNELCNNPRWLSVADCPKGCQWGPCGYYTCENSPPMVCGRNTNRCQRQTTTPAPQ